MLVKNIKPAAKKKQNITTAKGKKPVVKKQQTSIKLGMMMIDMQQDDFEQQMLKEIQQENRRKQQQRIDKEDKLKKSQPQKLQVLQIDDMGEFEKSLKMKQEEERMKEMQREKKHQERLKMLEQTAVVMGQSIVESKVQLGDDSGFEERYHLGAVQQEKGNEFQGVEQRVQTALDVPAIPQPQPQSQTPCKFTDNQIDQHITGDIIDDEQLQVDTIEPYEGSVNEINSPQAEELKYVNDVHQQQVAELHIQQQQQQQIYFQSHADQVVKDAGCQQQSVQLVPKRGQYQQFKEENVKQQWQILVEEVVVDEEELKQQKEQRELQLEIQQQEKRQNQSEEQQQQQQQQQFKQQQQQQLQQQHLQTQLQQQQRALHQQQQHPHYVIQYNQQPIADSQEFVKEEQIGINNNQYYQQSYYQPKMNIFKLQQQQRRQYHVQQRCQQRDLQHHQQEEKKQQDQVEILPEIISLQVQCKIIQPQQQTIPLETQLQNDLNNDSATNITVKKSPPIAQSTLKKHTSTKSMSKKKKSTQAKASIKQPKSLILSTIIDSDEFMLQQEEKHQQISKLQQQQQYKKQQQLNKQQKQQKQLDQLQQKQQQYTYNLYDNEDKDKNKDEDKYQLQEQLHKLQQMELHNNQHEQEVNKQELHHHVEAVQVQQQLTVTNKIGPVQSQQVVNSSRAQQQPFQFNEQQQQQLQLKEQQQFQQQAAISFIKPSSSLAMKKKKKPTTTTTKSKQSSSSNTATVSKKAKTVSLFLSQVCDIDDQGEKHQQKQYQLEKQQSQRQQQVSEQHSKQTVQQQQTVNISPHDQPSTTPETNSTQQFINFQPNRQQQLPTKQQQQSNYQQLDIVPDQQKPKVEQIQFQQPTGQKHVQVQDKDDDEEEKVVQFVISGLKSKSKPVISANPTKKILSKKTTKKQSKTVSSTLKPGSKQQPKYQSLIIMDAEDIFIQQQSTLPQQQKQQQQQLQSHHIPSITNHHLEQIMTEVLPKQYQQHVMESHQHHNRVAVVQDEPRQQVKTIKQQLGSFCESDGSQKRSAGLNDEGNIKEQNGSELSLKQQSQVIHQAEEKLSSHLSQPQYQIPHTYNQPIAQSKSQNDQQQVNIQQYQQFAPILSVNKQKKKKVNPISVTKKQQTKKSTTTKVTKSLFLPQLQQFNPTITNEQVPIEQQSPIVVQQSNQLNQSKQLQTKTPQYYQQAQTTTKVEQNYQMTSKQIGEGEVDRIEDIEHKGLQQVLSRQQQQMERNVNKMDEDIHERIASEQTQSQAQMTASQVIVVEKIQPVKQQQSIAQLNQPIIIEQLTLVIPKPKLSKPTTKKPIKSTAKSQSSLLLAANKLSTTKHSSKSISKSVIMNFTIEENLKEDIEQQLSKKQLIEDKINQNRQIVDEKEPIQEVESGYGEVKQQTYGQSIHPVQDSGMGQFIQSEQTQSISAIQSQPSPPQQPSTHQSLITSIIKSQLQVVKLSNQQNLQSIRQKITAIKQLLAEKLKRKQQRLIESAKISSANQSHLDDELIQASEYVVSENVGLRRVVGRTLSRTQA